MSHALLMGAEILGAVALIASGVGSPAGAGLLGLSTAAAATVSSIATFAAIGAAVAGVGAMALQKKPAQTVNPMSWRPDPLAGVPEIMGRIFSVGLFRPRSFSP